MQRRSAGTAMCVVLLALLGGSASAVLVTLDYNGFNPGEVVTAYQIGSFATPVATQAANVAGDTQTTFTFDLTTPGQYAVDMYGNVSTSSDRTSHRIGFNFDGSQVTSIIPTSVNRVTGFVPGTALTLYTVDVYVDPQAYNPPNDSSDGYAVQMEVGNSGRITLDDVSAVQNGGRAATLVNGMNYMVQYNPEYAGHRSAFTLSGGTVAVADSVVDETTTVDASGAPGATHQLARLNTAPVAVDANGLSYGLPLADDRGYVLQNLPADFDGAFQTLAGDLQVTGASSYRLDMTNRHATGAHIKFDVDAAGNVTSLLVPDDRIESITGGAMALRTTAVQIDVANDADVYNLEFKTSQTNPNSTGLMTGLVGDTELTLMPSYDGTVAVYFLRNVDGSSTTDARDSWRIEYDDVTGEFSLLSWLDIGGTTTVTAAAGQSLTLADGTILTLPAPVIPEPATLAVLGVGGLALLRRRRR